MHGWYSSSWSRLALITIHGPKISCPLIKLWPLYTPRLCTHRWWLSSERAAPNFGHHMGMANLRSEVLLVAQDAPILVHLWWNYAGIQVSWPCQCDQKVLVETLEWLEWLDMFQHFSTSSRLKGLQRTLEWNSSFAQNQIPSSLSGNSLRSSSTPSVDARNLVYIRQLFRVAARKCRVALFPPSSMNLCEVQQSQSTQAANPACFLYRTFGEKALNWKMLLLSCCVFFIFWLSGQAYFFCSKGF